MAQRKSEQFDAILREHLSDYVKRKGYRDFDSVDAPTVRGDALLDFYLNEVFQHLSDFDEDELSSNWIDGAHDKGIDWGAICENQVYIIQSKYGDQGKKKDFIENAANLPSKIRLSPEYFTASPNQELKAFVSAILKLKNPVFNIRYVTNANLNSEDITLYTQIAESAGDRIRLIGRSELRKEWSTVQSISQLPPAEVAINIGDEDFIKLKALSTDDYPTYIFTQKATKVKDLYSQHLEPLFNQNIRYWLGLNAVNRGMVNTIKGEPERFFFYNNGVTALCEEAREDTTGKSGKRLICKNFQIVNGAQTVTTISLQKPEELSEVRVLFKVIAAEVGKKVRRPEGLNENIVKNTNSQTVIHPSDFRSNDKVQIAIESEIRRRKVQFTLKSPFKDVFYKRKKRKDLPKDTFIISMQDLGKSYFNLFHNPKDLNAATQKLWDTGSDGYYWTVFGHEESPAESITTQHLDRLLGSQFLYSKIKDHLRGKDKNETPAVLFKFHLLWGFRQLFLKKHSPGDLDSFLQRIVTTGEYINPTVNQEKHEDLMTYVEQVQSFIDKLVNKEKRRKDKTFVMRNLQRDDELIEDLKAECSSVNAKMLKPLI